MMRRTRTATAALVLGLGLATSPAVGQTRPMTDDSSGVIDRTGCELPPHTPLTARNTVNGIPAWAVWRTTAQAQAAIGRLASAVETRFGSAEADPWQPLRNGYIGTAINDEAKTFTVVVDLGDDERAELDQQLQGAAGDTIDVRVGVSCHPASELAATSETVASPEFAGGSTQAVWSGELSPYDSRIHVDLYDPDNATTESMRDLSPDLIQVTDRPSPPFRRLAGTDRGHDVQPHWGGARIGLVGTAENECSSGFAVDTATAGKAFVTAGHCFAVGADLDSGGAGWGSVTREPPFPEYDMAVINGADQNYDDDIHMSPVGNPGDPIDVSAKRAAFEGMTVCVSGGFTLTTCNLEVVGVVAHACYLGGCVQNLIRFDESEASCNPGDSGSPVFSRINGTAHVTGMLIAEKNGAGGQFGCVAHKIFTIESALNVDLATSP